MQKGISTKKFTICNYYTRAYVISSLSPIFRQAFTFRYQQMVLNTVKTNPNFRYEVKTGKERN